MGNWWEGKSIDARVQHLGECIDTHLDMIKGVKGALDDLHAESGIGSEDDQVNVSGWTLWMLTRTLGRAAHDIEEEMDRIDAHIKFLLDVSENRRQEVERLTNPGKPAPPAAPAEQARESRRKLLFKSNRTADQIPKSSPEGGKPPGPAASRRNGRAASSANRAA